MGHTDTVFAPHHGLARGILGLDFRPFPERERNGGNYGDQQNNAGCLKRQQEMGEEPFTHCPQDKTTNKIITKCIQNQSMHCTYYS